MARTVGRGRLRFLFLFGGFFLGLQSGLLHAFRFFLSGFRLGGTLFAELLCLALRESVVAEAAAGLFEFPAGAAVRGTVLRVVLVGRVVVERVVEGGADADESEVRLLGLAVDRPVNTEDEAETDIQRQVRGTTA